MVRSDEFKSVFNSVLNSSAIAVSMRRKLPAVEKPPEHAASATSRCCNHEHLLNFSLSDVSIVSLPICTTMSTTKHATFNPAPSFIIHAGSL